MTIQCHLVWGIYGCVPIVLYTANVTCVLLSPSVLSPCALFVSICACVCACVDQFAEHRISFEEFADKPELLSHSGFVVRIKNRYECCTGTSFIGEGLLSLSKSR